MKNLEKLTVKELKEAAKRIGVKGYSSLKKSDLIKKIKDVAEDDNKSKDKIDSGILEVMPDGYGFLRSDNYLTGDEDIYVANSQIRRFNLKTGDWVKGKVRPPRQGESFRGIKYIEMVNGEKPDEAKRRKRFDKLTPIYPNEKFNLSKDVNNVALKIIDLFAPIGKGQRGMIVAPPKAGKTTILKAITKSILRDKNVKIIVLLIDERPEEVTEMKRAVEDKNVDVIYSTFDKRPSHHKRVAEMVLARAKRLVEHEQDVVVLLDSITRLARAYNLITPPSGRTLSGGIDPAALHMPKKFFGAARNIENGGSLTILGTALVDTGSKMDNVIFEEFKGTGNMEVVLDRNLAQQRIYPAINIYESGTRKEELLLTKEEQDVSAKIRRKLNSNDIVNFTYKLIKTFNSLEDLEEITKRLK